MPVWVVIAGPFLSALAVAACGNRASLRNLVLISAGVINLILLLLTSQVPDQHMVIFETLHGLEIAFHTEALGLIFALTAGALWPITSIYAIGYLNAANDAHQVRFHALFCIAIGSAMGIAFAENLFTLFLFYEILTFSTWPLVTHSRSAQAVKAGRIYLGVLLTTSIMMFLLGIVVVGNYGSSLSFVPGGVLSDVPLWVASALLCLFVFGIGKAAVMPFHRWLPNAMVAPAPVSALLHAVAVVKAGVFSILKISTYTFGFDLVNLVVVRQWLIWAPAITILLASAIAMRQDDIKARLAYSTVSQLSYIVLGALLANQAAFIGSGMHITMHAFGKITLFFCAGAIMTLSGKKYISEMNGLGRAMPWTFAAFTLAALSIAGLPPTGGLWSKWYLAGGAIAADYLALVVVLMASSLLNVYYLLSIPVRAFFLRGGIAPARLETRWSLVAPPVFTALISAGLFFFAGGLYRMLWQTTNTQ